MYKYYFLFVFLIQTPNLHAQHAADSFSNPGIKQVDLIDIGERILNKNYTDRTDDVVNHKGRIHFSAFPAVGYTLQTGFAGVISANAAFFTTVHNHETENLSTIISSIAFTSNEQIIFPIASSIWTRNNEYNILTDWRYLKYPSITYGLGGESLTGQQLLPGLFLYQTAPGCPEKNHDAIYMQVSVMISIISGISGKSMSRRTQDN